MYCGQLRVIGIVALVSTFLLLPDVSWAVGGSIVVKGGVMRVIDSRQVFEEPPHLPVNVVLERDSNRTGGIGWEVRMRHGLAVGAEFLSYRNDFGPAGVPATGEAKTSALLAQGKKYFFDSGVFHPYIGGGFGLGSTHVNFVGAVTQIDDNNLSFVLHAVAGMEMRVESLSFTLEVRRLYFSVDGSDVEYDPSAFGAFFGAGVCW